MTDKMTLATKLLWVDLEMTGLNPEKDVIIEVAAEITDFEFKTLETYDSRIKHDRDKLVQLFQQNTWYRDEFPENRDDFLKSLANARPSETVESELVKLVEKHFGHEPAILAGNSIHNDRLFIKKYWPTLDLKLHYRMLDVTAWKIVMQSKFGVEFEKQSTHRAFDDIQASVAELQYYLEFLKSKQS